MCLNKQLQRHQKNAICVSFTQVETNCDNKLWLLCKCLYKNPCIRDLLVYENENVVWYMHECDTTNIKNLKNLQNQVPITDDCENYLMNVSLVLIGQFSASNVYQCTVGEGGQKKLLCLLDCPLELIIPFSHSAMD